MPLTKRWTRLKPHPIQLAYRDSPHRFNVMPCGRRSGKTERFKRKLVAAAIRGTDYYPARFFAGAPTRDQARRIFWEDLKALIPAEFKVRVMEGRLVIVLPLSEIHVLGMDRPERIEGTPWDGGGLDEYANMKPEAWGANVRPALSDRQGWCDLFGVPEGRNHYYRVYEQAKAEMLDRAEASEWGAYSWPSRDILPAEEIEAARRDLDPLTFAQEYEASFVNFVGRAYYPFGERHKAKLEYNPRAPLIFCFDFNVDPGVAVVCQEQRLPNGEDGTGVIGEVWIPTSSNTPAVCRKLLADWGEHAGPITVYGDATGGARGTAQTEGSDWDIVRKMLPRKVRYQVPKANPSERARVNAMNSRLESTGGTIRLMVDPSRAPHVVTDLEGTRLLEGGSGEIDKRTDPTLTHPSDALGYYVVREFPVRDRKITVADFAVT